MLEVHLSVRAHLKVCLLCAMWHSQCFCTATSSLTFCVLGTADWLILQCPSSVPEHVLQCCWVKPNEKLPQVVVCMVGGGNSWGVFTSTAATCNWILQVRS